MGKVRFRQKMRTASCSGCDRKFVILDWMIPGCVRPRKSQSLKPHCAALVVYSLMQFWGPTKVKPLRRPSHRQRALRFGGSYEKNITLRALIERDGDDCRLCGEPVEKGVWGVWNPRGGSIDHIVPMSTGGGHTWDNVQVAHRICNTRKGTKLAA